MAAGKDAEWTEVYETRSVLDAELVRTTLEVAGYRVSMQRPEERAAVIAGADFPSAITVAVPAEDADDARDFIRQKMSTLPSTESAEVPGEETRGGAESIESAAQEILNLRGQHQTAACKYCGIATLDVSEAELDSHKVALLRASGLGVNSATFSEFQAGERICSDCAGHEVSCDLCGRTLDAFLDEGEYRQANDDEAYVCSPCIARLEEQLQPERDW